MLFLQKKKAVYLFGALIVFVIALISLVFSVLSSFSRMEDIVDRKEKEIVHLQEIGGQFIKAKEKRLLIEGSAIGKKEKEALLSAISKLVSSAGIKNKMKRIDLQEKNLFEGLSAGEVLVGFEGISIRKLKDFLRLLSEYGDTLHVKRLDIERDFEFPELFNCSIVILVFEKRI